MTEGQKSSERKLAEKTFYSCFVLALYGIYKDSDLTGLAAVIGALSLITASYTAGRSYKKAKNEN